VGERLTHRLREIRTWAAGRPARSYTFDYSSPGDLTTGLGGISTQQVARDLFAGGYSGSLFHPHRPGLRLRGRSLRRAARGPTTRRPPEALRPSRPSSRGAAAIVVGAALVLAISTGLLTAGWRALEPPDGRLLCSGEPDGGTCGPFSRTARPTSACCISPPISRPFRSTTGRAATTRVAPPSWAAPATSYFCAWRRMAPAPSWSPARSATSILPGSFQVGSSPRTTTSPPDGVTP